MRSIKECFQPPWSNQLWGDPANASTLWGQFDGGEEHAEVGEDLLSPEGSHGEGEDALAAANSIEGDLSHLIVQVDPYLPVEEWDGGVGRSCEGHTELIVLLQAPNLSIRLEEDPAFPLNRLTGHPNGPEAPVRFHLPVVTARGEALAAQHARIRVELARTLRPPASRSTPAGLFEVLREDHLRSRRGRIQGHIHW